MSMTKHDEAKKDFGLFIKTVGGQEPVQVSEDFCLIMDCIKKEVIDEIAPDKGDPGRDEVNITPPWAVSYTHLTLPTICSV